MPDNTKAATPSTNSDYPRFEKLEGANRDRVDDFLKERVAFTAREWAVARLCADFQTKTGVEMTKIGENLPELVPFLDDTYSRQAVYQARHDFEEKVRRAGATFLYGAMCDFFTADELDDILYEATEVARFLLEVEGANLDYEQEAKAEEHVREAMQAVREASVELRYDQCPHCGEDLGSDDEDDGDESD